MTRVRTLVLATMLLAAPWMAGSVAAQGSGAFLCSLGTRDGQTCASDDDCPGGVCVLTQGVCDGGIDDGLPCSCAGGTCSGTPVCSADATFGTCSGGPFAGECCDRDFNCREGRPCAGTQKICLGGQSQGFPCLRDSQCPGSVCRSTGRFCLGVCQSGSSSGTLCTTTDDCGGADCFSDYQDAACGQDVDCCVSGSACPAGICTGITAPTPTATQRPPTATAGTAQPTSTRTPTVPGTPASPTPVVTPTVRPTTGASPTRLPAGQSLVIRAAAAGDRDLALQDATSFPETGLIEILTDPAAAVVTLKVGYSRAVLSNTLSLDAPLSQPVPAGSIVRSTPRGGMVYESVAEGAGCAMQPVTDAGAWTLLTAGLVAGLAGRRRLRRAASDEN